MSHGNAIDLHVAFGGHQDLLARHLVALWTQWTSARNLAMDRWDEIYRYIFATSTTDTTNETVTDWSNRTHRPKLANLFDTLTINYDATLFPNDDWLRWLGSDSDSASKQKRMIVEAYMKTKHRLRSSGFRNAIRELESDWVWTGNAFASVDYVNEVVVDPRSGEQTTAYTGPRVTRIDPRMIAMQPKATSFKQAPKILRSLYTMGELHRIVEERPDQQHFRNILDVAMRNRDHARQYDQGDLHLKAELAFDGFGDISQYLNSGLVEVIEFFGDLYIPESGEFRKNHVVTVVDQWTMVRDEPIHTWSGVPHIFHVGWRERPGNLWAQGPLENLVVLQ